MSPSSMRWLFGVLQRKVNKSTKMYSASLFFLLGPKKLLICYFALTVAYVVSKRPFCVTGYQTQKAKERNYHSPSNEAIASRFSVIFSNLFNLPSKRTDQGIRKLGIKEVDKGQITTVKRQQS